jgi:hypothetical protein
MSFVSFMVFPFLEVAGERAVGPRELAVLVCMQDARDQIARARLRPGA